MLNNSCRVLEPKTSCTTVYSTKSHSNNGSNKNNETYLGR